MIGQALACDIGSLYDANNQFDVCVPSGGRLDNLLCIKPCLCTTWWEIGQPILYEANLCVPPGGSFLVLSLVICLQPLSVSRATFARENSATYSMTKVMPSGVRYISAVIPTTNSSNY